MKRPGDRADLEHRAGLVAEALDAPAHDLAHAGRDERRAGRRVVGALGGRAAARARPRRTGCRACAGARPRRSAARPPRAAARGRPPGRARRARSARRASRPRSRRAPPGTPPRPRCRRPRAARARRSRRRRRARSSRSEDASAQCRSSRTSTSGESAAAAVSRSATASKSRSRCSSPPVAATAPSSGPSAGSGSPATRPLSARTTGRQTPYGRPSASPRPRTATPPRLDASLASASSSVVLPMPVSPATTTVRTVPLQAWVSALRRRSSSGPRPTTPAGASTSSVGRAISRSSSRETLAASCGRSAGSGATSARIRRSSASGTPGHAARRRRRRAHPEQVLGVERPHAAEQLVERHAEREEVAQRGRGLAQGLLGGGVAGRAGRGRGLALGDGDAEVPERRLALGVDPHVVGLDVAVDDAVRMGVRERVGDLAPGRDHLLRLQASRRRALQPVRQRPAGHVARDEAGRAVVLEDVVDGDDVAVAAEARGQARLAPQPLPRARTRLPARALRPCRG